MFEDLRQRCPVAYSDVYGGFWVLSRYKDIRRVALDDGTFSSADSIVIPPKQFGQRSIPIEVDPPLFFEYRRVLNPFFAPAAVDRLERAIEGFVHECIDNFIETGACDLVHDLADPLPAKTTLTMLGLPVEHWKEFSEPLHAAVFLRQDHPAREQALAGLRAMRAVLAAAIAERRTHPRDDMITALLHAEIDGEPLSDEDVLEMVHLTIQGGFDTTGSAIGNALVHLDEDRDARQGLLDHPELLETAVEEFLRYEAPQLGLARTAKTDCVVAGTPIRAGEKVFLLWASGNRDASVFDAPDTVQLDRSPNRHMTFGLGAHHCLGAHLARREIRLAVGAVLDRLPDYAIERSRVQRADTVGVVYGNFAIPATFTPGPRRSSPAAP